MLLWLAKLPKPPVLGDEAPAREPNVAPPEEAKELKPPPPVGVFFSGDENVDEPPKTGDEPKVGLPPKDGLPPKVGFPPNAGD